MCRFYCDQIFRNLKTGTGILEKFQVWVSLAFVETLPSNLHMYIILNVNQSDSEVSPLTYHCVRTYLFAKMCLCVVKLPYFLLMTKHIIMPVILFILLCLGCVPLELVLLSFTHVATKCCINLTHLPQDKMATNLADNIFYCIFLNENVWISIAEVCSQGSNWQ